MNLKDVVEWSARKYPNKTALIYDDNRITYAQLNNHTNSLVHALGSMGVKKGDRVAILGDMCHQYGEIALAIPKGGMVLVPLNYRLVADQLAHTVIDSGSETIIVDDRLKDAFESMRPYLKGIKNLISIGKLLPGMKSYEELISSFPPDEIEVEIDEQDIAYIVYTSGTTARPKGAMRSHKSMIAAAEAVAIHYGVSLRDVCLMVMPPFHVGFLWPLTSYAFSGCTMVIRRWSAADALRLIDQEKVTFTLLGPFHIQAMLDYPELKNYDVRSLRRIGVGSTVVTEELARRAISYFGNIFNLEYGMTEYGPSITVIPAEEIDLDDPKKKARLSSCGRPLVNNDVRIVDDNGNEVKAGEVGEVIIKGDAIFSGYWNLPEETTKTLRGGYLHTGDLARFDAEGYLHIVDRLKDMIKTGSENVYCPEVEAVLRSHPAVLEAAVIGVPDDKWGEAVKACIVLKPETTARAEEIIDFCRFRLAGYKRPKTIDFFKELPRSPMGKIAKKDLREQYWAGYERRVH